MLNLLGTCGRSHLDGDEYGLDDLSPCSSPKGSSKKAAFNNPYADRGLDKFSALLADIEAMKQKIYTQRDSDQISFVRFAFSNSNHVKPIVVKRKKGKSKKRKPENDRGAADKEGSEQRAIRSAGSEVQETGDDDGKKLPSKGFPWEMNQRCCLPVAVILALASLAVYGRAFAIMCASIGWYVIPINTESPAASSVSGSRKKMRKLSSKVLSV
ncbi:unnamed protein product [Cuscuta campestris]|uniref:Uncharacterized protein n=1 Tax=Cuscuta campestris TaxID=132261 RepID=A0A484MFP0_9ASTE|nr:unnamed protein product [Cuscuta campestris]